MKLRAAAALALLSLLACACGGKEDKAEKPAFEKLHDALEAYGACIAPEAAPEEVFGSLAGRCFTSRLAMEDRVRECQDTLRNAVLKALEEARFQGRGKLTQKLETFAKGPTAAAPVPKDGPCAALAATLCDEHKGWLEGLATTRGEPGKTDPTKLVCRGKKAKAEAVAVHAARLPGGDGQQTVEVLRGAAWASLGAVPAAEVGIGAAAFEGGAWLISTRVPADAKKDDKKKPKKGEPEVLEAAPLELVARRLGAGGAPLVAAERPKLFRATLGAIQATGDGALLVGGDGTSLVVARVEGGKLSVTASEVGGVGGTFASCVDGKNVAALSDDRRTLLVSQDGGASFAKGPSTQIALGDPELFCQGTQALLVGRFGADRVVAATCEGKSCGLFVDLPKWDVLGRAGLPNGVGLLREDGLFVVPLPAATDQRPPRAKALLVASEVDVPKGAQAYRVEGALYQRPLPR